MTTITLTEEDDWCVITDDESGVTTQGETKLEALLMLADALAAHDDTDEDLLATALDIFVPDPEDEEFLADLEDEAYDPPEVTDEQVARQREATLWLAKSHKKTDYSDPHRFGMLLALIYGNSHGITFEHFGEFVAKGYWDVLDSIATGTRRLGKLSDQLDADKEFVEEAVTALKRHELIAEAADGSLYAAQRVVGVGPYVIDDENIIDWQAHYDHTLARDVPEDEVPETVEDGVYVERMGTGYGWYHDPGPYKPPVADEVIMTREEAEANGANPCPRCFPESEDGQRFEVTNMGGGTTRYAPKEIDEDADNK